MSSISSTTKAFSILGKLIYSNVDTSVFTEVITNACDSHITAKQTAPVSVTMVGSNIHIRDFGTGIKPEAIDTVYMKFFESTKEEDSSVCGKFGLGSKCIYYYYTGVFEVKTVVDGYESHYKFEGGDGKHPSKEILYENIRSDSPTGVEVSFKVKDINAVKWHLAKLATFSNVEINVSSILDKTNFYKETTPSILKGTKWKTYIQTSNVPTAQHMRGATIIQNGLLIQAPATYSTENFIVFPLDDKAVPLSLDRTEIKLDTDDLKKLIASLNTELKEYVTPLLLSSSKYELLSKAKSLLNYNNSYIANLLGDTSSMDRSILRDFEFNRRELLSKFESTSEINAVYYVYESSTRYSKITNSYDVPNTYDCYNKSWYILPPRLSNGMNKVKHHMLANGIKSSGVVVASDTTNKKDWCLGFDNYLLVDKTWKHTVAPTVSAPKIKDEDRIHITKRKNGERDVAVKLSELKPGVKLLAIEDRAYFEFLDYDECYCTPTFSSSKDQKIFDNYLKTNSIEVTSTKDVYDYMAAITSTPEFDDYMEKICDSTKHILSYNLSRFLNMLAPLEKNIAKRNILTSLLLKRRSALSISTTSYSVNYDKIWNYVRTHTDNLYYASLVETLSTVVNISQDIKDRYPLLYQMIEHGSIHEVMIPNLIDYINLIDQE